MSVTDNGQPSRADLTEEQLELLCLRLRRSTRTEVPPTSPSTAHDGSGWVSPIEYPLSPEQRQLWFVDQLDPGDPAYNVPFVIRMVGPLHGTALRAAVEDVVARHEPLRTRIVGEGARLRQVVAPPGPIALPVLDLAVCPTEQREDRVAEVGREHAGVRFVLDTGPLLRLRLVRLADDEHLLFVVAHHIVRRPIRRRLPP